jgi:hypothetical protein
MLLSFSISLSLLTLSSWLYNIVFVCLFVCLYVCYLTTVWRLHGIASKILVISECTAGTRITTVKGNLISGTNPVPLCPPINPTWTDLGSIQDGCYNGLIQTKWCPLLPMSAITDWRGIHAVNTLDYLCWGSFLFQVVMCLGNLVRSSASVIIHDCTRPNFVRYNEDLFYSAGPPMLPTVPSCHSLPDISFILSLYKRGRV